MKKRIIKVLSATLIGCSLFVAPANATVTGWNLDANGNWNYIYSDGSYADGWSLLDGKWYYFDSADTGTTIPVLQSIIPNNHVIYAGIYNGYHLYYCNNYITLPTANGYACFVPDKDGAIITDALVCTYGSDTAFYVDKNGFVLGRCPYPLY